MTIERTADNWFGASFQAKFAKDAAPGTFAGYGAVFGNVDSHGDVISKGAFKETLKAWQAKGKMPKMLLQHAGGMFGGSAEDAIPIGQWTDMAEDDTGLRVEGKLFALDTDLGKRLYEVVKAGEMDGLSIGYRVQKENVDYGNGKDAPVRNIKALELFEVSLVLFGSNPKALVDQAKAANRIKTIREFENFLRDSGFSNAAAKAIAASGFKAHDPEPRDEDGKGEAVRSAFARLADAIRPT